MREVVERQIAEGATEDEAVAADLPQYRQFRRYARAMEMAIRRTYLALTTGPD